MLKCRCLLALLLCLVMASASVMPALAGDCHWQWVVPPPAVWDLTAVTYGDGLFVAVGAGGTVVTSPDGATWTQREIGTDQPLRGVAWANGLFVAVGGDGTSYDIIFTSADGVSWVIRQAAAATVLDDLCVHDGTFMAQAQCWESPSSYWSGYLSSRDGVTWTRSERPPFPMDSGLETGGNPVSARAYGNGLYVGVGQRRIYSSADGQSWTVRVDIPADPGRQIAFGNGRFVTVTVTGTDYQRVTINAAASVDGLTWDHGQPVSGPMPVHLDFTNGRFFIFAGSSVFTSVEGIIWDGPHPMPAGFGETTSMVWGNGCYLAVMYDRIATSTDGRTWVEAGTLPIGIHDVVFGNGVFVGWGFREGPSPQWSHHGKIATSRDGVAWTLLPIDYANLGYAMVFDGCQFMVAWKSEYGQRRGLLTSADGLNWTETDGEMPLLPYIPEKISLVLQPAASRPFGEYLDWHPIDLIHPTGLAYGNGRFVAVGSYGTMRVSPELCCGFADVSAHHTTAAAIAELVGMKAIGGFPDGLFHPDDTLTRAQVTKMLTLVLGLKPDPAGRQPFADASGSWATTKGYLQAAVARGLIAGYRDGTFRPDRSVTRAELIKMASAAAGLSPAAESAYGLDVTDGWWVGWAGAALRAGLVGPDAATPVWTESTLSPDQPATRTEAAIVLANLAAVVTAGR